MKDEPNTPEPSKSLLYKTELHQMSRHRMYMGAHMLTSNAKE